MIGGIIWGVMGDRIGRMKVLLDPSSSTVWAILPMALSTMLINTIFLRFVTGIGLAGELGAGITLVSELLSKEKKGIGTSLVAGVGLTGCVVAYFISRHLEWRTCYFLGGGLGLLLLLLRVLVLESGMFHSMKDTNVQKGNFSCFLPVFIALKIFIVYPHRPTHLVCNWHPGQPKQQICCKHEY